MKLFIDLFVCVLLLIIIALTLFGCSTWRGFREDTGFKKPEIPPSPENQLWEAAKKSNWLVTLSVLGVAAGVFALVNGSVKLGTASIASASVSLFMALAVSRFALWMAVFGLIGSVTAVLFSILIRRRALVEIIKGVQKFKNGYPETADARQNISAKLHGQSHTTKKIVGNIKNELKLTGEI